MMLQVLLLLLGAATATAEWPPLPKLYPISFSISFVTNITTTQSSSPTTILQILSKTTSQHGHHAQNISNNAINGKFFHDYAIPAQTIYHGPGSYECMHFYKHPLGCSLVFVNSGMYRILHHHHHSSSDISNESFYINLENKDTAEDCCLDLVDLHPPPPNWANNANPTYNGIVLDKYSQKIARRWSFDNLSSKTTATISAFRDIINGISENNITNDDNKSRIRKNKQYHTKMEVAFGEYAGRPLLFTFPSAVGNQDMYFLVDTMMVGPQHARYFELPDDCLEKMC